MSSGTKNLAASIIIGGAVSGTLKRSFNVVGNCIRSTRDGLRGLRGEQEKLNAESEKFSKQFLKTGNLKDLGTEKEVRSRAKRLAALKDEIKLQSQKAAIERLSNRYKRKANYWGEAKTNGLATLAAVGAPVMNAIKQANDFQYEMQLIGNTAEMTAPQIAKLQNSIFDLSDKTGQSVTELRSAMGKLIAEDPGIRNRMRRRKIL